MQGQGTFSHTFKRDCLYEATGQTNSMDMGHIYLALLTAIPTPSSSGSISISEVSTTTSGTSNGYGRVLIGNYSQSATCKFGTPTYDSSTGETTCTNKDEIHFNSVKASWGAIKGFALLKNNGEVIAYGTINDEDGNAIEDGETPAVGNIVFFKAGDIKLVMQ